MGRVGRVVTFMVACLMVACLARPRGMQAQSPAVPRHLSATETGCDSLHLPAADTTYEAGAVDRPVRAPYVRVNALPYRMRDVLSGHTMLRFVVEPSGSIDRCSIVLLEETSTAWTEAVLTELRRARYQPARKGGVRVRQIVYQVFTYHNDGRPGVSQ